MRDGPDAALAAALFAVDPVGCGGIALRAPAGAGRQAWLDELRALLPPGVPWRRVPLHVDDERLLGGLDLAASLQAGRPVGQSGLLVQADGGVLELAMAERLKAATLARLAAAIDTGEAVLAREGLEGRHAARFGVVALDEGLDEEERVAPALLDRLAFHASLDAAALETGIDAADVALARSRLAAVEVGDAVLHSLCATGLALGIGSARAVQLAVKAACAAAALDGVARVDEVHAALAARLVLAPRATRWPAEATDAADPPQDEPPPPTPDNEDSNVTDPATRDAPLDDLVLAAAQAAIPAGLLAALQAGDAPRARGGAVGRRGAATRSRSHGRPIGSTRGDPRGGARLDLLATLRAAAPWQRLRPATPAQDAPRLRVRREDFRIRRFEQRSETTTIFAVDASGSAALHRLAETKGAVELLLADCYVRRDRVAVLSFRGAGSELLLPPTRSLVRARRSLAGLPGGGGTPLAAGIAAAAALADAEQRRGISPLIVLLTDGRANVARDGAPGREAAIEDALVAARQLRAARLQAVLIDTSPQAQPQARQLATAMGARYLPLPHADAAEVSRAVRAAAPSTR